MFVFDDKSAFVPEKELRTAFKQVFGKHDPLKIDTYFVAAVDYFWDERIEPIAPGEQKPWQKTYSTKADLAQIVLAHLMTKQLAGDHSQAFDEFSKHMLVVYGKMGLVHRGNELIDAHRPQEAIEHLKQAVSLQPEDGYTIGVLAKALAHAGHSDQARPLFRKAAELEAHKYLDCVCCPGCGWIPDGTPYWECGKCSEEYDTFATRGKCSKCSKESSLTQCVGCGKRDRHESFWL